METEHVLDDTWIREFENTDKLYKDFYKDNIYYINLRVIYVNRGNEIDKIKQESFLMSKPNVITREEILSIIKRNAVEHHKRYSLLSILKYNILLDPDHVKYYLHNSVNQEYLTVVKNIDHIPFEKSISMFQDINDLILIFYEKSKSESMTKKVYVKYPHHQHHQHHKRTIRKQYKD